MDETRNIREGPRCTLTQKKMGETVPGVPHKGAKKYFVFLLSPIQRGLSATYPAPISTIFETKEVNRCPHAYSGEKFQNFCAGGFQVSKQLKWVLSRGCLWAGQLKRQNFGR